MEPELETTLYKGMYAEGYESPLQTMSPKECEDSLYVLRYRPSNVDSAFVNI